MSMKHAFFHHLAGEWKLEVNEPPSTGVFTLTIDGNQNAAKVCIIASNPGEFYLDHINVAQSFRGRGYMSRVLDEVTAHADSQNVQLSLLVADFDGIIGEPKLIEVYERYGFVVTEQCPDSGETTMERLPRAIM